VSAITFLGAQLAEKHPIVTTWQVPPPSTVDDQALVTDKGSYVPLKQLGMQSVYPVLQGYKRKVGVGAHAQFDDPLSLGTIGVTAAWTPSQDLPSEEKGHVDVRYQYLGWHAGLAYNRSDFYDLFGPTIRSRRGYQMDGGYDRALIYDEPRRLDFKSDLAYYHNLDALPQAQNIAATAGRLVTAEAGLYFTDVRKSRGAVDDEKGVLANLMGLVNYVDDRAVPQLRGGVDLGVPLIAHSSLWLRTAAGVADGARDDPYANFFFGGFGNNYVDARVEKRYREYDAFPGFAINELNGRSFGRAMLEANLPPVVFESVGTPAFHLAWMRPALFASQLWTDPVTGSTEKNRYANVGGQVDFRFSVLHWYEMTLSFGYAVGYRSNVRAGDEWMVSLKIM